MKQHKQNKVIVVGTGIVGLMSAYYLHKAGYKVTCFDFGPDPTALHYDERMASTTYRSGNARHVTATETSSLASSSRKGLIYKSPSEGGWMSKDIKQLTLSEKKWVDDFEYFTHHPEIIDRYNDDICRINNMGKKLWYDLIRKNKKIFGNVGLQLGVGIFFLNRKHFMKEKVDSMERAKSEADFEDLYNPKVKRLNVEEVKKAYPAFEYACNKDLLVGGLTEDCITVNSIDLCANIINFLRNKGVTFHWGEFVVEMKRNENGEVSHLVTAKREILRANHYVLSTGWLTHGLYKDTKCEDKIMGVLGCWIYIPNPGLEAETLVAHAFDPNHIPKCFKGPFKIDTPEPTNYINATLEGSKLIISGGYGFIGNDITNIPNLKWPGVKAQFNHFETIVKKIFPKAYEEAELAGSLDRRMCARPVTACGLGVFEELQTVKGGKLIIVGANAAGGFTQAPALAEAVVDSLKYKHHQIHKMYSPSRLSVES